MKTEPSRQNHNTKVNVANWNSNTVSFTGKKSSTASNERFWIWNLRIWFVWSLVSCAETPILIEWRNRWLPTEAQLNIQISQSLKSVVHPEKELVSGSRGMETVPHEGLDEMVFYLGTFSARDLLTSEIVWR